MLNKNEIQNLIKYAIKARSFSYSPYSNYKVGSALLTSNGKIFTGCNIESASYTPTTCAERVAVLKAVSEGEKSFVAIAVIGGNDTIKHAKPSAPCGVCRQLIYEFGKDIQIIIATSVDDYFVQTISDLLPNGFGPDNLK